MIYESENGYSNIKQMYKKHIYKKTVDKCLSLITAETGVTYAGSDNPPGNASITLASCLCHCLLLINEVIFDNVNKIEHDMII